MTIFINAILVLIQLSITRKNTKELEELKTKLRIQESKLTTIQQKRIDVYSELWKNIQNTSDFFISFSNPFQQYPDLKNMNEDEVVEFLDGTELSKSHKNAIISNSDKNQKYQDLIFWYRLKRMQAEYTNLYSTFVINKILFSEEQKEVIGELITLFHNALINMRIGGETMNSYKQNSGYEFINKAYTQVKNDGQKLIDNIEKLFSLNF